MGTCYEHRSHARFANADAPGAALLWSGTVACTASSPASDAHPQPDASKHLLAVGRPVQSAARRAIGNASWAEALRMERWADAARVIDALPRAERSDALVRYARARAAMELEDAAQARALLVGLERELPELRTAILNIARSRSRIGPSKRPPQLSNARTEAGSSSAGVLVR